MTHRLFLDLDGVLADFEGGYARCFGHRPSLDADDVDWTLVASVPGFYATLDPMPDAKALWHGSRALGFDPIVLTGVPRSVPSAAADKRAWVARHFGEHVEVVTCRSREKYRHGRPGDVLVDDWEKYRDLWVNMGGVWITHVSASETLRMLRDVARRTRQGVRDLDVPHNGRWKAPKLLPQPEPPRQHYDSCPFACWCASARRLRTRNL